MNTAAIVGVVWLVLMLLAMVFLKLIGDRNAKMGADNEQLYYDMMEKYTDK